MTSRILANDPLEAFDFNTATMAVLNLLSPIWLGTETKIGIFIAVLLTSYLSYTLYCIFLHPLSTIPGPLLAKFSNLWINIRYMRGSWHEDILAAHRKYGDVVRITANEVSFVNAQALKVIYGYSTATKKVGGMTSILFAMIVETDH